MKIIWPLLLLFTMAGSAMGETRGLKVVVRDQAGTSEEVDLYQGSYALLIGASDYQSPQWPDIESIPDELDQVETILKAQGFSVSKYYNPTKRQMVGHFRDFIDEHGYDEGNRLLFFYAGHGYTRKKGNTNKGYLVPVDAPSPLEDEKGFQRKALSMSQILTWARESEAKHSLFLFDSCFSGTIFQSRALAEPPKVIKKIVSLPVRQFITAGSAGETVPSQSTFTPAFISALEYGKGDLNEDGYVSGTELGLYLQNEVPKHTDQTPQFGKIKDFDLSQGDFVFVLPRAQVAKAPTGSEMRSLAGAGDGSPITVDASVLELEFWQSIKDSNNPDMYQAFLDKFPEGTYAALAKQKLVVIEQQKHSAELEKQRLEVERLAKEAAEKDSEFWRNVKNSENPEMYQAYLGEFPEGIYVALAKQKLVVIEQQKHSAELERQRQEAKRQREEAERKEKELQLAAIKKQREDKKARQLTQAEAEGAILVAFGSFSRPQSGRMSSSPERLRSSLLSRFPTQNTPFRLVRGDLEANAYHILIEGKVLQVQVQQESESERRAKITQKQAAAAAVGNLLGAITGVGALGSLATRSVATTRPPLTDATVVVEIQAIDSRDGSVISEMAGAEQKEIPSPSQVDTIITELLLSASQKAANLVYTRLLREAGIFSTNTTSSFQSTNTQTGTGRTDLLTALLKTKSRATGAPGNCGGGRGECSPAEETIVKSPQTQVAKVESREIGGGDTTPAGQGTGITGLWIDQHGCHVSITANASGVLNGAAWGRFGGSMEIILAPMAGNDKRFDWKGRMKTTFSVDMKKPRKRGRFTINRYDDSKLHTSASICSTERGKAAGVFRRIASPASFQVRPPNWYVMVVN